MPCTTHMGTFCPSVSMYVHPCLSCLPSASDVYWWDYSPGLPALQLFSLLASAPSLQISSPLGPFSPSATGYHPFRGPAVYLPSTAYSSSLPALALASYFIMQPLATNLRPSAPVLQFPFWGQGLQLLSSSSLFGALLFVHQPLPTAPAILLQLKL